MTPGGNGTSRIRIVGVRILFAQPALVGGAEGGLMGLEEEAGGDGVQVDVGRGVDELVAAVDGLAAEPLLPGGAPGAAGAIDPLGESPA
jgi:hypothetical protein